MWVFLHTRKAGEYAEGGEFRTFARLPATGEYLALSTDGPWYQVELVVFCPFPCHCEAEVYAVEVDHNQVKARTFADAKVAMEARSRKR
jgi:hypothetical protein